jgi:hypothetical protein
VARGASYGPAYEQTPVGITDDEVSTDNAPAIDSPDVAATIN